MITGKDDKVHELYAESLAYINKLLDKQSTLECTIKIQKERLEISDSLMKQYEIILKKHSLMD